MPFSEEEERVLQALLSSVDDLSEDQARAAVLRLREQALNAEGEGLKIALPQMNPGVARRALETLAERHYELADDIGHEEERKRLV
jgi:hypothetical protein